jgi:hypothetical protein
MRRGGFVALVVALVLTGCSFGSHGGLARGVARPTPQATSSEPPYDRQVLAAQTKRALMAHEALLGVGGPTRAAEVLDEEHPTSRICNGNTQNEGRTGHVAQERVWATSSFTAFNVAHGYNRKTGAEAVGQVREAAGRCTSFRDNYFPMYSDERSDTFENVSYDMLGVVEFPAPGSVEDRYGGCLKETYLSGAQRVVCFAYLGRKNLLSAIYVTAGMDQAAAQAKLLQIIPIAAAALVRA